MSIIYFNGDSFTDHGYFREESYNVLSTDNSLIINNSISGNWNTNIVKQTNKELIMLNQLAEKNNCKVHAFIFLSESLRSPIELAILAQITKTHGASAGLEFCLAKLTEFYYEAILANASRLKNVCVHVSTAFTDLPVVTDLSPMYKTVCGLPNLDTTHTCYTVSYPSKYGDTALLKMGFSKEDLIKLIDASLDRCKLLETVPDIIKYHFNNRQQYRLIIDGINNLI
jgi:hypothetical protein